MLNEMINITPYPEINAIIHRLKLSVLTVLKKQFIGMYIHGSLALGDFIPESSDIDFLVVTASELSEKTILALSNMHTCILNSNSKWARKLEGSYVLQDILKQQYPPITPRPYTNGDKFCLANYGGEWVLERHVLREHGIVITGPPIQNLIDPIHPNEIRQATLQILNEWWLPMLQDSSRLKSDEYQAYAILTMCRILYTLKQGTIVSKPRAAAWVMKEFNCQWAVLIEQALSWREGRLMNVLNEVTAFIRFTQEYFKQFAESQSGFMKK